jgi:uncharacterized protein YegL
LNTLHPMRDIVWSAPKTFDQIGVAVVDGSSSMAGIESISGMQKAESVEKAVTELAERLATSDMAEQYALAVVSFDNRVEHPLPPTLVLDLDPTDLNLDLLRRHGGSTAIGDALAQAGQVVEQFLADEQDGIPRYAVILLMSDGQSNSGEDPLAVAQRLKTQFNRSKPHGPELVIATAAYGDDADAHILGQIASDPAYHRRVESGVELRNFFFRTITRSLSGEAIRG